MPKITAKQETKNIRNRLRTLIKSIPDIDEDEHGKFWRGSRKVWLDVGREEVTVKPIEYWYTSLEEVKKYEFELKDAIDGYLKNGFTEPRLTFDEEKENGRKVLYCTMKGAGITIQFRPKWFELLNGVNRMVFTEYKNAKTTEENRMIDILKALQKITTRAQIHCRKLGYDV